VATTNDTCCSSCVPEYPAVTINNYTIEIGDSAALWKQEELSLSGSAGSLTSTLASTPISDVAVLISISGVVQDQGDDYTIAGAVITWVSDPDSSAKIIAYYLAEA